MTEAGKPGGREGRPASGWESLTEAEQNVAALVAKGMTNEGVAASLFITVATVKTHLSHSFSKLGISKRSELAEEVWRRREASLGDRKASDEPPEER